MVVSALTGSVAAGPGVVPTGFQDVLLAGGLDWPVAIALLPDGRVLFTEQFSGRIRLVVNGAISAVDPVCTVPGVRNNPGSEQGLLGLAIDPQWPGRPYLYVHYDDATTPTIHIARFTVTGDLDYTGSGSLTIDPASRYDLITDIPDNGIEHNGGTLRFGPDGRLYVSLGEDGVACASQDTTSLLGKILRLEVAGLPAGPGGPPARSAITPAGNPFGSHPDANARLIWTMGLRNPFRFWIDTDGALFIGDVGRSAWEEIDRVAAGGLDMGWPLIEGNASFGNCPGVGSWEMVAPIYTYPHVNYNYAVIGGPLIRVSCGTLLPADYIGSYFFADYYDGFLRRLVGSGNSWSLAAPVAGQPNSTDWGTGFTDVSAWAIDCAGRMCYCRQSVGFEGMTGEIRRVEIEAGGTPGPQHVDFRPPWPSPARGAVTFDFTLAAPARVELTIYDGGGRLVRRVVPVRLEIEGDHREVWDGRDEKGGAVGPGLYFARLVVDGDPVVRRFPLL